jgi:uncharacterized membrane protein YhaH (DUF805 family)
LGAMFSFRGRINRLQYFAGNFALCLALALAATLMFVNIAAGARSGGLGSIGLGLVLELAFLLTWYWTVLSLQARRLRDMGWSPSIVMPAWFALALVDRLIAGGAASGRGLMMQIAMAVVGTPVGGLINLALGLCLLFWPSKTYEVEPRVDGWPLVEAPSRTAEPILHHTAPAPLATTRALDSPAVAGAGGFPRPPPAQPGFGRRGL